MSSHHIVRDEQEPALLILDPEMATWEQVGPLMEWSPTFWVTEEALEKVISWGIKIDGVFADPASAQNLMENYPEQQPFRIIPLEKGQNPLALGLELLSQAKYAGVNVFCNITDSDFLDAFSRFSKAIQCVFFTLEGRQVYVESTWEKWLPKGVKLMVWRPEGIQIEEVEIHTGLQFLPEESTTRQLSFLTLHDGKVALRCSDPFWLVESI